MIFRVLAREDLGKLFDVVARHNEVIGPVETGRNSHGDPIHGFEPVQEFSRLRLDYTMTGFPPKRYYLPFREDLASFRMGEKDWEKKTRLNVDRPRVFFGLHPCDINALNRLDKVLLGAEYPMSCYAAKRRNMFIIGYDCFPGPSCFCRSMGADTVLQGFHMYISDIGDRYFVEILSNTAFHFLKEIGPAEPTEEDFTLYRKRVKEKNRQFTARVDTTDLTKILDMEFDSPLWRSFGDRCLGCGACSQVCPTCYCYGVEETVSLDLSAARKVKTLHSCSIVDFAQVAGGHNFRPDRPTRLKYRFYHKHRGFVEAFEEPLCTGCGRCGEACIAGITVPEVIASVRGEERE